MPNVLWILKSVRVYFPFVCLCRALESTTPSDGLARLAVCMFEVPLLSADLALGSGVLVTVVVAAAVDWVGASEVAFDGAEEVSGF